MQTQSVAHPHVRTSAEFGDVRVVDLLHTIREHRRAVLTVAAVIFAIMSVVVFLDQPVYRAYVTLAPARPLADTGQNVLAENLFGLGLAEAGQFDVFQPRTSTNEAFALLNSRAISRRFIESENLLPVLFADQWNSETDTWKRTDPDQQPSIGMP